jgi:hypothetical protein
LPQLGSGEPQRLEHPDLLRIAHGRRIGSHALALELFHPFLNPRFRVDQSFAGITH